MYEVLLFENEEYTLTLDVTSGSSDLAVYVFKPTFSWGSRTYMDWKANNAAGGGDESLTFTADSTGYYGIAIINENASPANYTIGVVENASRISPTGLDGAEVSRTR